jgi:hypothetical protein
MERHEGREYHELVCPFCPQGRSNPVIWLVYDGNSMYAESMMVCETHKYTAFS